MRVILNELRAFLCISALIIVTPNAPKNTMTELHRYVVTLPSLRSITDAVLKLRRSLDGRIATMRKDTKMKNLMKQFTLLLTLIGTTFLFTVAAQAATFTVTNTNDSGFGSLRKAIDDANSNPGADTINFNITGGGVHTIVPLTSLPALNDTVDLNGYSQPGTKANTLAQGDDAVLLIELNGAAISANTPVILFVNAAGCTIRGLVINRSAEYGIYLGSGSSATAITGNFIGTDVDGLFAQPNGREGVHFDNSSNNVVGGTVPAARNVISGNTYPNQSGGGVYLRGLGSSKNKIQGNFIGTNRNGNQAISSHQAGVYMDTQASNNTIGGTTASARNIISGNSTVGVGTYGAGGNLIEGNYIGTDVTGTFSVANPVGIAIASNGFFNQIGDAVAGAGNLISGNTFYGIDINGNQGQNPYLTQVLGNFIGTNAAGTGALGNGREGVRIQSGAFNNIIGTTAPGAGNIIAFNGADPSQGGSGVHVVSDAGNGNLISGNSIFLNKTLGIDLDSQTSGVTANDDLDGDSGPNDLQNFPVIVNATYSAAYGTQIGYSLSSKANTKYTVEVFVSDTCNASGYGEGKELLSSFNFSTGADGLRFIGLGSAISYLNKYITATATDPNGSTSEFSKCVQVTAAQFGNLSFSTASYSVNENGGTATITVQRTGGSYGAVSVQYATLAGGTANVGSDYAATSGTLNWADGDNFDKTFTVAIVDDNAAESTKTINLALSNPGGGATIGNQATATLTITDNDNVTPPTVQFNAGTYSGQEDLSAVTVTVMRNGDTSGTTTVDYATADGTARQQGDYELTSGTLLFAPGDTTQTFQILINEDSYVEGAETVNLTLSNPTGGASLGAQSTAVLTITDDAVELPTNPNDEAQNFVYQQYHDLLNREPDAGGLAYWTGQITQCGNDQNCLNTKRKDIAAAFYIELEFQETGYFVYRMQKASYGTQPTYLQFMADRSRIDANKLKPSKQAFTTAWMQRANFKAAYPDAMPADQYVNKLYDTAGLVGYQAERLQAIQALMSNTTTRAQVLRDVIETPAFKTQEYNPAFVLMQYFGYLRRDADPAGYQFWLNVINNQVANDTSGYHAMVCGFVTSAEYQDRFGALHTHGNNECQ
jgi:hypothetical protein